MTLVSFSHITLTNILSDPDLAYFPHIPLQVPRFSSDSSFLVEIFIPRIGKNSSFVELHSCLVYVGTEICLLSYISIGLFATAMVVREGKSSLAWLQQLTEGRA